MASSERWYRLGIDIGGTFTDFALLDSSGQVVLHKVPTTPSNPADAVRQGVEAIVHGRHLSVADLLRSCEYVIHGSTISTNAIIQRTGVRTGLLCTAGFRDVLEIGDGHKPDVYNLKLDKPTPLVPRYLRQGVVERIDYAGEVLTPIDEDSIRAALRTFRNEEVASVAVVYLWSSVNASHERRTAAILEEELPGVPVMLSSDILPLIREWPRTAATVLSAYVQPIVADYLRELEQYFSTNGLTRSLLIMQCTGGCATVEEIVRQPVYSILSGPAAAPIGALKYAEAVESRDVISIDMGGTSFDVCLIRGGEPTITADLEFSDLPLGVMATDIHSIGAGGGSIAWIDAGGALAVGPQSAGAVPGPACYGRGGYEPTVTDVDLLLGYLDPNYFLGGAMTLYPEQAEAALRKNVADPFGMTVTEAAEGVFRLVNFKMVQGISAVSIQRGLDPRDFVLVVGGGAGPIHAGRLAQELGIGRVIIPRNAAALSASGMVMADITHDYMTTHPVDSPVLTDALVADLYHAMEDEARRALEGSGVTGERIRFQRYFDASYVGQVHELMMPFPPNPDSSVETLVARFHEEHERLYTYAIPDNPVRFYHWRLRATGALPCPPRPEWTHAWSDNGDALKSERRAYFPETGGFVPVKVFDGERLLFGDIVPGPAIVESPVTTIVVLPGHQLSVNRFGDYEYHLDAATPPSLND